MARRDDLDGIVHELDEIVDIGSRLSRDAARSGRQLGPDRIEELSSVLSRGRAAARRVFGTGGHHEEDLVRIGRSSNFTSMHSNYYAHVSELVGVLKALRHDVSALGDEPVRMTTVAAPSPESREKRVFIGHGRSPVWRDLKDFLGERLALKWDEYNREPSAGMSTKERLEQMLAQANFAFLVMTAEDEQAVGGMAARPNVIHEVGLFQGKLGFMKAIVLLEDGCDEFSNIVGLSQIRFPKGDIKAKFEEIRRVLEREGLLDG